MSILYLSYFIQITLLNPLGKIITLFQVVVAEKIASNVENLDTYLGNAQMLLKVIFVVMKLTKIYHSLCPPPTLHFKKVVGHVCLSEYSVTEVEKWEHLFPMDTFLVSLMLILVMYLLTPHPSFH